ncbi:MAG: endonuclease/exonuclease/phosphatase family protein [Thermonemataceae bacterium]|nr:endonuclease/exonuclease/phosphatase family protein [Thermonemataceae bacterium]
MKKTILLAFTFGLLFGSAFAQKKSNQNFIIGFYNIENLFDTEDDPAIDDAEFLPSSQNQWNNEKYQKKLTNMAKAIASIGEQSPDILGLCEVENKKVLEDLIQQEPIKAKGYEIIHYNSPDERGIDVAMIYKKEVYAPFKHQSCRINFTEYPDKTRDFLVVSGLIGKKKDTLHIIVAHFPSRRGGMEESQPKRVFVANEIKKKIDSIQLVSPNANVMLMGDLNDEPINKSIVETLNAKPYSKNLKNNELFNAMGVLKYEGKGTHAYYNGKTKKTEWNLLDQIIMTPPLVEKKNNLRYVLKSARIHQPDFLMQVEPEQYKGQPLRTFAGKKYLGGYSDHFPVFVRLQASNK